LVEYRPIQLEDAVSLYPSLSHKHSSSETKYYGLDQICTQCNITDIELMH